MEQDDRSSPNNNSIGGGFHEEDVQSHVHFNVDFRVFGCDGRDSLFHRIRPGDRSD
jgi:hypothetical protein